MLSVTDYSFRRVQYNDNIECAKCGRDIEAGKVYVVFDVCDDGKRFESDLFCLECSEALIDSVKSDLNGLNKKIFDAKRDKLVVLDVRVGRGQLNEG